MYPNPYVDTNGGNFCIVLRSNRIIPKKINIRVEHVKHSNCRLDFLKRVKANEEKKRIAKEQGVMGQYKREVSSVSLVFRHGWLQPHLFAVLKWYESVCVRNELQVCTTLAYPHITSFHTMPVLYTSTRILRPFEDSEPMGLKVDIAVVTVL